jgi:manganese/iron transport system permease protein/iron/zinc/copper transport system permease protein
MDFFTEPLQYEFFRNGLIVATLVGALCGLMGVFIVLRRMSYIGHGLSHSVFGGAVVAYLMSWNFYIGAGLWGFFSALLINATARRRNIGADAAIGIVTTASFALGVALISRERQFTRNFEAALFGNILGVTRQDILIITGVFVAVLAALFFSYKQLLFTTFDPEIARVYGVRTNWVDAGFALALAATIVASMNIVGVTLIAAAIVVPPSTARLISKSFGRVIIISTVLGAGLGFGGMFLSFEYDIASGASIVLLGTAVFMSVYAFTGARSWLQHRQRFAVNQQVPAELADRPQRAAGSLVVSEDHSV